jgi:F-type H+-transporting ATPase subunit b
MRSAKNFVWACAVGLFLVSLTIASRTVRAQAEPSGQRATDSRQQPEGIGRQPVRDTRDPAGKEEDETDTFKRSPSVRYIAQKLGISVESASLLSVLLNFAVIGVVVVWAGRKYLPGLFRDRSAAIQRAMQEAQKASEEARRRLAEIESRLRKLDVEIGMMRDAAEKEAAAEEARIKAAAEDDARKIVESAEQEIAAAAKAARRDLTAYAADLAVGLAKKQIHVDAATDQGLVHDFAGQLTSARSGPGKDAR